MLRRSMIWLLETWGSSVTHSELSLGLLYVANIVRWWVLQWWKIWKMVLALCWSSQAAGMLVQGLHREIIKCDLWMKAINTIRGVP